MWSVCLIFPSSLRLHEGITVCECLLSSERESTETVHTLMHAPAPLSLEARSVRLPRGKSLCCMESTRSLSKDGRMDVSVSNRMLHVVTLLQHIISRLHYCYNSP